MLKDIRFLQIAAILLALGVLLGAFGAHGLKARLDPLALSTYQTGVQYYFYHAFALILYVLSMRSLKLESKMSTVCFFLIGILLFSGCCFLYAITGIKTFAMIVPIGGVSFVVAWLKMFWDLKRGLA